MNAQDHIERLLRRRIGLDIESVGTSSLRTAVHRRMMACHDPSVEVYCDRVEHSETEADQLVEELVVPETWFFREPEAFAFLAEHCQGRLDIQVLSAPCATGEEPYSAAIALREAGLNEFRILGWDISVEALRKAEAAKFARRSFRFPMPQIEKYFDMDENGIAHLSDEIRKCVKLERRNLLDPAPLGLTFDAIFCRNLFIYLGQESRLQVIETLRRMLKPEAVILVAPSEQQLMRDCGFERIPYAGAFAFRPAEPKPSVFVPRSSAWQNSKRALRPSREGKSNEWLGGHTSRPFPPAKRPTPVVAMPKPPRTAPNRENATTSIQAARDLANAARYEEAWELCSLIERESGPTAELFYLKGLVRDAQGEYGSAAELYSRSIYLDPSHVEALTHLALLKDRSGDQAGAERIRSRLRRLIETANLRGEQVERR